MKFDPGDMEIHVANFMHPLKKRESLSKAQSQLFREENMADQLSKPRQGTGKPIIKYMTL